MKKFSVYNNECDNINQIVESIIYEPDIDIDIDIISEGIKDRLKNAKKWLNNTWLSNTFTKTFNKKDKAKLLAVYASGNKLDEEGSEKGKINELTILLTQQLGIPYKDNGVPKLKNTIDTISNEITEILKNCSKDGYSTEQSTENPAKPTTESATGSNKQIVEAQNESTKKYTFYDFSISILMILSIINSLYKKQQDKVKELIKSTIKTLKEKDKTTFNNAYKSFNEVTKETLEEVSNTVNNDKNQGENADKKEENNKSNETLENVNKLIEKVKSEGDDGVITKLNKLLDEYFGVKVDNIANLFKKETNENKSIRYNSYSEFILENKKNLNFIDNLIKYINDNENNIDNTLYQAIFTLFIIAIYKYKNQQNKLKDGINEVIKKLRTIDENGYKDGLKFINSITNEVLGKKIEVFQDNETNRPEKENNKEEKTDTPKAENTNEVNEKINDDQIKNTIYKILGISQNEDFYGDLTISSLLLLCALYKTDDSDSNNRQTPNEMIDELLKKLQYEYKNLKTGNGNEMFENIGNIKRVINNKANEGKTNNKKDE